MSKALSLFGRAKKYIKNDATQTKKDIQTLMDKIAPAKRHGPSLPPKAKTMFKAKGKQSDSVPLMPQTNRPSKPRSNTPRIKIYKKTGRPVPKSLIEDSPPASVKEKGLSTVSKVIGGAVGTTGLVGVGYGLGNMDLNNKKNKRKSR